MSILGNQTKGERIRYFVAINEEYEFAHEFNTIEDCITEIKESADCGEYDGDTIEIVELGEYYDGEEEKVLYRAKYDYDEENDKTIVEIEFKDDKIPL